MTEHYCRLCGIKEECLGDMCDYREEFKAHSICLKKFEDTKSTLIDPLVPRLTDQDMDNPEKLRELLPRINEYIASVNMNNKNDVEHFIEAVRCKTTIEKILGEV